MNQAARRVTAKLQSLLYEHRFWCQCCRRSFWIYDNNPNMNPDKNSGKAWKLVDYHPTSCPRCGDRRDHTELEVNKI